MAYLGSQHSASPFPFTAFAPDITLPSTASNQPDINVKLPFETANRAFKLQLFRNPHADTRTFRVSFAAGRLQAPSSLPVFTLETSYRSPSATPSATISPTAHWHIYFHRNLLRPLKTGETRSAFVLSVGDLLDFTSGSCQFHLRRSFVTRTDFELFTLLKYESL